MIYGFKNKNTNVLEYLKGNISKEEVLKQYVNGNLHMVEHFYTAVASMYTHIWRLLKKTFITQMK